MAKITIYYYDRINMETGRDVCVPVVIDDEDEKVERWIQVDLERRLETDPDAKPRTVQEIMKEHNRNAYNEDRRGSTKVFYPGDVEDDEGNVTDYWETVASPDETPSEYCERMETEKENKEKVKYALSLVTKVQARRIIKYYYRNMTYEAIAKEEKASKQAVIKSVELGLEKIKKEFSK